MGAGASAASPTTDAKSGDSLRPRASPSLISSITSKKGKHVTSHTSFMVSKVAIKKLAFSSKTESTTTVERLEGPFELKIERESLSISQPNMAYGSVRVFSYPDILCWGHSDTHWVFKAMKESDVRTEVTMDTAKGPAISTEVMQTVRRLMAQMETEMCSEKAFGPLKDLMKEQHEKGESILDTRNQMSMTRRFAAHQAASILKMVSEDGDVPIDHFDRVALCCSMYERLINRDDSFHVLLDCFPNTVDRENICVRLGIDLEKVYKCVR